MIFEVVLEQETFEKSYEEIHDVIKHALVNVSHHLTSDDWILLKSDDVEESKDVESLDMLTHHLSGQDWHILYLSYPERWLPIDHYKETLVFGHAIRPLYTKGMLFNMKTLPRTLEVLDSEKKIICDPRRCRGDPFKTQYANYYGYHFSAITTCPTYFK